MLLKFNHKHLSIESFNDIELGRMTVLTGVNGAGKTHLLDAIKTGAALVENIEPDEIVSFDYDSFKLNNESFFSAQNIAQERENAWQNMQNIRTQTANRLGQVLGKTFHDDRRSSSYWESNDAPADLYRKQIRDHFRNSNIRNQTWAAPILNYIKTCRKPINFIEREEFDKTFRPSGLKNDFLPMALGAIVWDYYTKMMQNKINRMQHAEGFLSYQYLTDERFFEENGEKPWVTINNIFRSFGTIAYEVLSPEGHDLFKTFQLRLVSIENSKLEIQFDALSSGERILMALVAAAYTYSLKFTFPRLLLLDEIDATLHPTMSKNLLSVINEVFLPQGTAVILATHSPSTVALADDEQLIVMSKSGPDRLRHTSKKEAVSILTQGFATLDEGILLFDQAATGKFLIISEGKNIDFIKRALEIFGERDISFIENVEDVTGKNQLKTLFDYMIRVPHQSKILFVWDCDVKYQLEAENNTFPFVFDKNVSNEMVERGIENLFPMNAFEGFCTQIVSSKGITRLVFDESRKKDFCSKMVAVGKNKDYDKFEPLLREIKRIKNL